MIEGYFFWKLLDKNKVRFIGDNGISPFGNQWHTFPMQAMILALNIMVVRFLSNKEIFIKI